MDYGSMISTELLQLEVSGHSYQLNELFLNLLETLDLAISYSCVLIWWHPMGQQRLCKSKCHGHLRAWIQMHVESHETCRSTASTKTNAPTKIQPKVHPDLFYVTSSNITF
jgi:hypothetical protein